MMNIPAVSVIIPTHNRCAMLVRSLDALRQQTYPLDQIEVLVVADDCQDKTEEAVREFAMVAPFALSFYSHSARSAAATRNLGAAKALGETLLFLDDDVLAEPDLVRAHMNAQSPNLAVFGYSKPATPENPSWWQFRARLWWEDVYSAMRQPGHRFTYRDFFSGNLSMSAAMFRESGGFDLTMTGRLEDYEFGLRLLKIGVRFRFVPEAIGYHHDYTDLALWLRRIYQEGVADVQIGQRHPEVRTQQFADFAGFHDSWSSVRRFICWLAFNTPRMGAKFELFCLKIAAFCERRRLRAFWLYSTGALREYNYWRGVASLIKSQRELSSWLQEAPLSPAVDQEAPIIDLTHLPEGDDLVLLLDQASQKGFRLAIQDMEIASIPPRFDMEPIREEHLWGILRGLAGRQFIPALAYQMIDSSERFNLPCSFKSASWT